MKTKLITILLLAASSVFAGPGVFVGVNIGPPPPPRVVAYRPPCPGPGYAWINGYWAPSGPRYVWTAGYWARTPYRGAHWVAPRYYGHRYYRGYWRR